MLTRDQAREQFKESGLAEVPITLERMIALREAINAEMLSSGLMDGTFHMKHHSNIKIHDNNCAELRCQSHYFDNREAVTFNENGFVGFAGWADDFNVQPILAGFLTWMTNELSHDTDVPEIA
jgi:hypothetical protein